MPLLPIRDKLLALTQSVYGGRNVAYTEEADREIDRLTELGFGGLPRCAWPRPSTVFPMTPQSWGPLQGFILTVRRGEECSAGAEVSSWPWRRTFAPCRVCPRPPAAEAIDVDENGVISGLF